MDGTTAETQMASVRWGLASLALAMLLSSMGVSIANVALPTLTQAFGAPFQAVQWVVIAYLLAVTIAIVAVGRLGDVIGHRRVLMAGIALFIAASTLCGLAPSLWLLIAARALQGLAAAVLMALTVALVRATVPKERTGSVMGLLGTMSAIGTALGPSLGGILIAGPGWRTIFLVMVPLGLLALALAHRHLPARARTGETNGTRAGFDGAGMLLLGLTLAAYTLAVTVGDSQRAWLGTGLFVAAALGVVLFVVAELRAPAPMVDLAAFRDRVLSAGLAMNVLASTLMMTTLVVGPFYLSGTLRLDEATVGMVMSVGPVISALSGIPAGRIVDRVGARVVVTVGLVQMGLGAFALAALPALFGIAGYIGAIAVLTPGYQLFLAANNTAVMVDVGADRRGVISGMLGLSRNLGLVTGASVMGAVFARAAGTNDLVSASPDAVAFGMQIAFAVGGSLMVVALLIGLGSRALAADGD